MRHPRTGYGKDMKRLSSIDGLRGLVVILMVMHHALDAWVHEPERQGFFWWFLRQLGGVPAPGFMLLAGLSAALVAARERARGNSARERALTGIRRGLYVLGIGFAFRVAMFLIDGNHWDEWEIIFRVDILNCMGVSLAVVSGACAFARTRRESVALALVLVAATLLPTPFIYGHKVTIPTIFLGNYIAGTGWLVLFPLFPWMGVTAMGYAIGEYLADALATGQDSANAILHRALWPLFGMSLLVFSTSLWIGIAKIEVFPPYDYFNASPVVMMMRMAEELMLLWFFAWFWRNDPEGRKGWVLQLLGRHSLFVYLVHLEFVYGRAAYLLQRQLSIARTFLGITGLVVAFVGVCWAMEWWQARRRVPRRAPAVGSMGLPDAPAG
jgi:uncharacterized membrane protein